VEGHGADDPQRESLARQGLLRNDEEEQQPGEPWRAPARRPRATTPAPRVASTAEADRAASCP
jgi:hypothetical protein